MTIRRPNLSQLAAHCALVALLLPALAFAQVDPAANSIGVYFDAAATQTLLVTPDLPSGTPFVFHAYLLATRVTTPGNVRYVRGHIAWHGDGLSYLSKWGQADFDECPGMPVEIDDWICEYYGPGILVTGPNMVLMRYEMAYFYNLQRETGTFYVSPFQLTLTTGQVIVLNPSSGDPALPVAVVNGLAPVAEDPVAWGAVKGLFR